MGKIIGYVCTAMVAGSFVSHIIADGHPPPPECADAEAIIAEAGINPTDLAVTFMGSEGEGMDPLMAIADKFFGGDMEAADALMGGLESTNTDPVMCGHISEEMMHEMMPDGMMPGPDGMMHHPDGMMPEDGMMHHPDGMMPEDGMMHGPDMMPGPDGMMPKDGMMHDPNGMMMHEEGMPMTMGERPPECDAAEAVIMEAGIDPGAFAGVMFEQFESMDMPPPPEHAPDSAHEEFDGMMDDKLDMAVAEEFFAGDVDAAAGVFEQLDEFDVSPEDCGYFPPGAGPPM
ncbi:MAG: hypothetical protein CBC09_07420 [Cellvibrionales bacterium TMED49]|nr:hypothetical protein [Porticoccaceae bacterium]OUU37068.1 MAG: hypothetical protein CBC09_07420 [Cellvibrionales bacterium TMED49]